jgi:hypothetical protein
MLNKIKYILSIILLFNLSYSADETMLLETTGVLSAQGLILTHTALGTTVDAWQKGVYKDDVFEGYIQMYQETITIVRSQLYSLSQYGYLSNEDRVFVNQIVDIYDAINKEANSILKFLYTKKDIDLNQYFKDSEAALNKLNNLFYE